jgi:hypothetical protein
VSDPGCRTPEAFSGHPGGDGLGSHPGDPNSAAVMVDEDEDVGTPKEHRIDAEEVACRQSFLLRRAARRDRFAAIAS